MTLRSLLAATTALALCLGGPARASFLFFDGGAYNAAHNKDPIQSQPFDPDMIPIDHTPDRSTFPADDLIVPLSSTDNKGCMWGLVGKPLSFQVNANVPPGSRFGFAYGYGAGPNGPIPGLTLSTSGMVTGTPTESSAGSFTYAIIGPDGSNYNDTAVQCYQIGGAGTSSSLSVDPVYGLGVQPNQYFELPAPAVKGNTGRVTWSISPPPPDGVLFQAGVLSGAAKSDGDYQYTMTITDSTSSSVQTTPAHVYVATPKVIPTLGTDGTCIYVNKQDPINWAGWTWQGTPGGTVTWSGIVPSGLTLNSRSGRISGTPDTGYANTNYTGRLFITASWTDDTGSHSSSAGPCVNDPAPQPMTIGNIPIAVHSAGETFTIPAPTVSGGKPPYKYATDYDLPQGLTFDTSSGSVSGKLTYPYSSGYDVKVTDATGNAVSTYGYIQVLDDLPSIAASDVCIGQHMDQISGGTFDLFPYVVHAVPATGATWSLIGTVPPGWVIDPSSGYVRGTFHMYGNQDAAAGGASFPFPATPLYTGDSSKPYSFEYHYTFNVKVTVPTTRGTQTLTAQPCVWYITPNPDTVTGGGTRG